MGFKNESYYFSHNYVDNARQNTPEWLINKKFKCIKCGFQPLYLKEDLCPFCQQDNIITQNDVSLNVGISILGCLEKHCVDKTANPKDKTLKKDLMGAILTGLPIIDDSKELVDPPEMYISKTGVPHIVESICDRLIEHYCCEYNQNKFKPQHISKISVRKLFGYHSYDLNFDDWIFRCGRAACPEVIEPPVRSW